MANAPKLFRVTADESIIRAETNTGVVIYLRRDAVRAFLERLRMEGLVVMPALAPADGNPSASLYCVHLKDGACYFGFDGVNPSTGSVDFWGGFAGREFVATLVANLLAYSVSDELLDVPAMPRNYAWHRTVHLDLTTRAGTNGFQTEVRNSASNCRFGLGVSSDWVFFSEMQTESSCCLARSEFLTLLNRVDLNAAPQIYVLDGYRSEERYRPDQFFLVTSPGGIGLGFQGESGMWETWLSTADYELLTGLTVNGLSPILGVP
jgi:hypothetical protein